MRVTFWHSDKPRERILADAFADGVKSHGDTCELRSLLPEPELADCDVAVMVGVKSRALYRLHWDAGIHIVYIDKGYTRHAAHGPVKLWEYWRVSVDAHHPTDRLFDRECPPDRWEALGLAMKPWRTSHPGQVEIVIAGSSRKYHEFYGMKDPTEWTRKVVRHIRQFDPVSTIVYRPKPSWREAVPIDGTLFSDASESIDEVIGRARVLVTHGSNTTFEAMLAGVPSIILGNGVTRDLSSTDLSEIQHPREVAMSHRMQWARNLAYFQWTMPEMSDGKCWGWLRPMIYGRAPNEVKL